MSLELFANVPPIGLFKGFSPLPHELEVDVVVPHTERELPGFGEFLLVELSPNSSLVARVNRFHAAGQLTTERGDVYLTDLARTNDALPPPLMRQMLRYTLKMEILGHLAIDPREEKFTFSVGQRSFATLGSQVRVPSHEALAFLCNVGLDIDPTAVLLGHLAYGQRELPDVNVRFSISRLKNKRTFVFARAGYGKSNLIKFLMSQLYSSPPDVGLLIFDPEGEYALPDAHGRPGLFNVPGLRDRISLYTNRNIDPQFSSIYRGSVYVDFGDFPPQEIVTAFVTPEKQDAVFANLLRSQDWKLWKQLVELLAASGFAAEDSKIGSLLAYRGRKDDVSLAAIKNNLVPPIKRLHRAGSTLGKNILEELRQNRVVIVDTSLLGTDDSLSIAGMLLWRIFQYNVRHLTDISHPTIRCLAVLEEAQTMLGDRALDNRSVFVRWVKEGRKYGLGCVLVTQQPSSISSQIISQGDNFFVLHLLNQDDLQTLKRHNAYFTDGILSFIRSEPIPGNCYFWSAPSQPFVLPVKVRSFDTLCRGYAPPPAVNAHTRPDTKSVETFLAVSVKDALESNPRVWLYPVKTIEGKSVTGLIALSSDYLQDVVARDLAQKDFFKGLEHGATWLESELPARLEAILKSFKPIKGYATLAGAVRPVWVLPKASVKPRGGKTLRAQSVEVSNKF